MTHTQELGAEGEQKAADYLKKKDYAILDRNWRQKWGELDIVAKNKETIVFCEVKTIEKKEGFLAEDEIDNKKLSQLRKLAQIYLSQKKIPLDTPYQIDIIAIEIDPVSEAPEIRHLENVVEDVC